MKLYSYWRSSASYRVRIAFNLKGIAHEIVPVHLVLGEQLSPGFRLINPSAAVPALMLNDGTAITQSLAIIDYLEEICPEPPLLPADPLTRARVRAASQIIACDIHPLNNLRVTGYLKSHFGRAPDEVTGWIRHWMRQGLEVYAAAIDPGGIFSFGASPSLADLCLIPQLYNANRWNVDLTGLDRLRAIEQACANHPAFSAAAPERQPDAQ